MTSSALSLKSEAQFQAGEPITLSDSKGRRRLVFLRPGERLHSTDGYIECDALLGQAPGALVTTSKDKVVAAYRSTFEEYVLLMKRAATVVPPKDIPFIVQWADLFAGARVVEAGLGSGALTMGLLRAVGPSGKVHTFDLREDHFARGLKNIESWPEPLMPRLEAKIGNVCEELLLLSDVDRVVLDLPQPWEALDGAAQALCPGGIMVIYVPSIRQIDRFVHAVYDHKAFTDVNVAEVILRDWVADKIRLRPDLKMVGHSGFLARCRRKGPKVEGTFKKAEASDETCATEVEQ